MNNASLPLVVLAGPTASGKTELSLLLAEKIGGEIISADSMQVYRHMNIGSAKIRPGEMRGIPHHLIDVCEPTEEFNVVSYQKAAREAIRQITGRGKIPILVGGTGFYIQAVVRDIDFTETGGDPGYRSELENLAAEGDGDLLYKMLQEADPESAASIHPNNRKRIIRALEFHHDTGEKISGHNQREKERSSPYRFVYFVLNLNRQELYRRINLRVDRMLSEGLTEEVRMLKELGCRRGMVSMQGLGYKEILDVLEGRSTLQEAVELLKRDTRHFAKRQLTWFRREKDAVWIDREDYSTEEEIAEEMIRVLKERGIIGGMS